MSIQILANGVRKVFVNQLILDNVSFEISGNQTFIFQGVNGSGKSTLLKLILGYYSPNEGELHWMLNNERIPIDQWHLHYSFAAPYLELIEEYSLKEFVRFHRKNKKDINLDALNYWLKKTKLLPHQDKWIKHFSSGMKQRLKLALCFSSQAPVLILDEPGSNLDAQGFSVLQEMLEQAHQKKLILLASNDPNEYTSINEFKTIHL